MTKEESQAYCDFVAMTLGAKIKDAVAFAEAKTEEVTGVKPGFEIGYAIVVRYRNSGAVAASATNNLSKDYMILGLETAIKSVNEEWKG